MTVDDGTPPPLVPGFTDLELIGTGSNGAVWSATQVSFERRVALRVPPPGALAAADLERTTALMGRLSDVGGVVPLYQQATAADGRPVLVMALMNGSLADLVARSGPPSRSILERWQHQTTLALEAAHARGVFHGNVRPENLVISTTGDVFLTDFRGGRSSDPAGDDRAALLAIFDALEAERRGGLPSDPPGPDPRSRRRRALITLGLVAVAVVLGIGAVVFVAAQADDEPVASTRASDERNDEPPDTGRPPVTGTATSISVSDYQGCSLLEGGVAACWGMNTVLVPEDLHSSAPESFRFDPDPFALDVPALATVEMATNGTGNENICGITLDGEVLCRGFSLGMIPEATNDFELNRSDVLLPVAGITRATQVAVGYDHACAVVADGTVWCWGSNATGQLGADVGAESSQPVAVSGLDGVRTMSASSTQSCAVRTDQVAWCWGDSRPATPVAGLPTVIQVDVGPSVACSIDNEGALWCWGDFDRMFGQRMPDRHTPPTKLDVSEPVVHISVGRDVLCAVGASGSVWCWRDRDPTPSRVDGITDSTQVATETTLSCALRAGGAVSCWGVTTEGPDGDGTGDSEQVPIAGLGG